MEIERIQGITTYWSKMFMVLYKHMFSDIQQENWTSKGNERFRQSEEIFE